jgi:hypothetical protein
MAAALTGRGGSRLDPELQTPRVADSEGGAGAGREGGVGGGGGGVRSGGRRREKRRDSDDEEEGEDQDDVWRRWQKEGREQEAICDVRYARVHHEGRRWRQAERGEQDEEWRMHGEQKQRGGVGGAVWAVWSAAARALPALLW